MENKRKTDDRQNLVMRYGGLTIMAIVGVVWGVRSLSSEPPAPPPRPRPGPSPAIERPEALVDPSEYSKRELRRMARDTILRKRMDDYVLYLAENPRGSPAYKPFDNRIDARELAETAAAIRSGEVIPNRILRRPASAKATAGKATP